MSTPKFVSCSTGWDRRTGFTIAYPESPIESSPWYGYFSLARLLGHQSTVSIAHWHKKSTPGGSLGWSVHFVGISCRIMN